MTNLLIWLKLPMVLSQLIPSSEFDSNEIEFICIISALSHKKDIRDKDIINYIISISIKHSLRLIGKVVAFLKKTNDVDKIKELSKIMRLVYQEVIDCIHTNQSNKIQKEFFTMIKVYIEKQQIVVYNLSNCFLRQKKIIM